MRDLATTAGLAALLVGCPPPPWDSDATPDYAPHIELTFPSHGTTDAYCPVFTAVAKIDDFDMTTEGAWQLVAYGPEGARLIGTSQNTFVTVPTGDPLLEGHHEFVAELVDIGGQPLDPPVVWRAFAEVADESGCLGGSQ
jgi:hypothetical protein